MGMREWLSIIFMIGIALIIADGFRRKWIERRRSLRVKLDKNIPLDDDSFDYEKNNELPNGGARPAEGLADAPYYGSVNEEISESESQFDEVPVLVDEVDIDEDEIEEKDFEENWDDEREQEYDDLVDDFEDEISLDEDEGYETEDESELEETYQEEPSEDDYLEEPIPEEESESTGSNDRIEPSFGNELEDEDSIDEEPMVAEDRYKGSNEIRNEIKAEAASYTKEDQAELFVDHSDDGYDEGEPEAEAVQEVIVLNVMAVSGTSYAGEELLPILMKQNMRLGDMSIFHRYGDSSGNGPIMFSMANMVKPGTFDITEMEEFSTPGISFFLQMPNNLGNMNCFERMLEAANAVKDSLGGDLRDEDRNIITRQTLDHSRETIRDFELKQLSNK